MRDKEDNLNRKHQRKVKAKELVETYATNNIVAPEYT